MSGSFLARICSAVKRQKAIFSGVLLTGLLQSFAVIDLYDKVEYTLLPAGI
jgi:hypothetical protein